MYNKLFITNLTKSLKKKHILIDKILFSKINNSIQLNVHSFFGYKKIRNYKKKTIMFKQQTVQSLNQLLKKSKYEINL